MRDIVQNFTPLALLALCGLVWLEPILPGSDAIREMLGETGLLRLVTGLLCLFVTLLWFERRRLYSLLDQLVSRMREAQGRSPQESAVDAARMKIEAMSILVEALDGKDPAVRQNAVENLERLSGQKFGNNPDRWRRYVDEQKTRSG